MEIAVSEGGTGGGTKTFTGPPITISGAGGTFEPEYVTKITPELTGNTDTLIDQCGYAEVRRSGTVGNWNVSVEGVVGEIALPVLMTIAESDENVTVSTPALADRGGEFVVEKCTINHEDELNGIDIPMGADINNPMSFKITLQSPKSAKGD